MKDCCVVFHNHKRVPVLPTLYNPSWHLTADRRSHGAVIGVYDDAANVIETHEHTGDFKEP